MFALMLSSLRSLAVVVAGVAVLSAHAAWAQPDSDAAAEGGESPQYQAEQTDEGITILRDGQLAARHIRLSGSKPVLWPVIGHDGVALTRAYPLADAGPHEARDHVHHRSLWFTHGEVNGIDFWSEGDGRGKIAERSIQILASGPRLVYVTENDWLGPDGERIVADQRRITFQDLGNARAIDFEITLRAPDAPVVFGDTKEGSFGIRVAGSMKVDAGQGGQILTSGGERDGEAWGQKAEWVDYSGPVGDGEAIYGIAILNHPSSFAFPTRWHVRTYGLFAANPFGEHHFTGGAPTDGVRLATGEQLTLRYRILLHRGRADEAEITDAWETYAAQSFEDVNSAPSSSSAE